MKLNRRNLYFKVPPEDGDDVRTLQIELRLLGIPTPEDEIRKGYFGIGTHKAVVEFQRKFGSNLSNGVNGVVDNLTAELLTEQVSSLANIEQLKRFQVRGIVRNENGEPVTNLIVKAYDMDLRPPPTELGVTTTDADGKYQIDYSSSQFKRAEKDSADLFVRVYRSNNQEPLIESLKIFNSPPVTTVDLTIGDTQFVGISEYEQILIEVTPLMQGVTWSQINENKETQDISFITSETGLSREKIDYLVIANKLAQTTKLPAESFYL